MAVDLGLDPKVVALRNARTPAEWVAALYDLAVSYGNSMLNRLGAAALLNEDAVFSVGAMLNWTGGTVPDGFLLCDGSTASKATYPDLAAKLGTTWGPETATTFTLPDFRRRVAVCFGSTDSSANSNAPDPELGSTGGNESKTLALNELPRHRHGAGTLMAEAAGGHAHSQNTPATQRLERFNPDLARGQGTGFGYTGEGGGHHHEMEGETDNTGAASPTAFSLYSTCVVVDKIIRT